METTLPPLSQAIAARIGDQLVGTHQFRGDETVIVKREALHSLMHWLRDDAATQMNFLIDLTCVDYLTYPESKPARFEVVYHLYSLKLQHRLRVKVPVNLGESVETISDLWANADWMEREAWEMFGVKFANHPNLKRLMTHVDFVGYPLRKDYPLKKRQPLSETDSLMDEMDKRLRQKGLK